MNPKSFLYSVDAGVGTITLNRPDRLNALTFEVYRELTGFFRWLATDDPAADRASVIVITGEGRAFCSGGDVREIIGPLFERDMAGLLDFTRMTCDLVRNIRTLRKPVVASLNGTVAGAGAAIALASDFRLASDSAKIAFLFSKVGLSGADMGAAWLLPKVVGLGRATELLMLGDFIPAEEARAWGLYHRVFPGDSLAAETRAFARRLADGPLFAYAMTKEMLNRELNQSLEEALEDEAQAQAICMQHPDYREAYEAFVEKRSPRFARKSTSAAEGTGR